MARFQSCSQSCTLLTVESTFMLDREGATQYMLKRLHIAMDTNPWTMPTVHQRIMHILGHQNRSCIQRWMCIDWFQTCTPKDGSNALHQAMQGDICANTPFMHRFTMPSPSLRCCLCMFQRFAKARPTHLRSFQRLSISSVNGLLLQASPNNKAFITVKIYFSSSLLPGTAPVAASGLTAHIQILVLYTLKSSLTSSLKSMRRSATK